MNKIAKDMSKVYRNTHTIDLIRNKDRKKIALWRLQRESGYWARKEYARLLHMIHQIDVELEARALQKPLF